jgi:predicted permease
MKGGREVGDRRVDEEIRHHIEERIDRLIESGVEPAEARSRALVSFGDVDEVTRELHTIDVDNVRSAGLLDALARDVSHAVRTLRRRPRFTAMTVGTLALGIGAATAIFGLVRAVILEPLPWPDPDRLVHVQQVAPDGRLFSHSVPDFADLRDGANAFASLAAMTASDVALGEEDPVSVTVARVTADFFDVLGGRPQQGRTFSAEEMRGSGGPGTVEGDVVIGGSSVVVLSHGLWQARFGGGPVVGSDVVIEGRPATVIGVMAAGWDRMLGADLWMPLALSPSAASREDHYLDVVGRLADGRSLAAAQASAERLATSLAEMHPATNEGWTVRLTPLKRALLGEDRIRAGWVLLGAVGLLLLLACVSVSNLLIARASTRGMEMSVRLALGAGRGTLMRQLLVESLVIGLLATVAGVAIAFVLLPALRALTPADTPRIDMVSLDMWATLFAAGVGVVTGVIFGMTPVAFAAKRDPASALRTGRGLAGGPGERVRSLLVAGQVALTVALLVGAGLLGSTFLRLQLTDTGLPVERVWSVPLMMARYSVEERASAAGAVRRRLAALPGVRAAGSTSTLPFGMGGTVNTIAVEGRPSTAESAPFVRWRLAGEGFFDAIDAHALEGRLFEPVDFRADAEPVVVVGSSLARLVAGDERSAVGRRIAIGWDGTNWRRIIGVVRDVEDLRPQEQPPLTFYLPGVGVMSTVVMLVRVEGPPAIDATAIRDAIHDLEPGLPVPSVERLEQSEDRRLAGERFQFLLVAAFSLIALVLAIIGVYGVTRYSVTQRVREVCVRMALGARPADVVRLLLGRSLVTAWCGVAAGLVLALALSTTIESLLFRTSARDPLAFLGAAAIAALACLLATLIPARQASRTPPATMLST